MSYRGSKIPPKRGHFDPQKRGQKWPFFGPRKPPQKGGSRGGPRGGPKMHFFSGVQKKGVFSEPETTILQWGGENLSRLGELLNTLENVHFFAPRGVPGGPPETPLFGGLKWPPKMGVFRGQKAPHIRGPEDPSPVGLYDPPEPTASEMRSYASYRWSKPIKSG